MSISVKSRFAGLLRGLLRQMDGGDAAPRSPAVAPQPVAAPAAPAQNFSTPPRPVRPDEIELPIAPVIAALPMDLRARLMSVPPAEMTICLPVETVTSQLAFGAVKITFGELRQLAAGLFANSGGENDNRPISLPLQEILSRLNPALFTRRPASTVKVAEEIVGPFAGRGQGLVFTTQPLKAPAAPKPPPPPAPVPAAPTAFTPPAPRQMAPPPVPPAAGGNRYSLPISPLTPRPTLPPPNGTNGNGHDHTSLLPATLPPPLTLKVSAAPVPPVPPTLSAPVIAPPAAPRPEPAQPTIFAALSDLLENWPEELKNEIIRSPLADVSVPFSGAVILPGLKRGRVTMTWKQIRTLARPSSPPSVNDNLELELPLKVLAPLFFAAQKNLARPRPKPAVAADIPDLFFGFPQSSAPAAAAPPPPPQAPARKPGDTNFYVWGENGELPQSDEQDLAQTVIPTTTPATDFTSRQAHPKDVVTRAAALPGVAGALVALQDGLRVASEVPGHLSAEALAAFLPQIFERLNQSTRELRMGALNNVNFTVGNVPWKIFRVNSVYFAAFGRAGESLPAAQLAQLAAELERKKQQ